MKSTNLDDDGLFERCREESDKISQEVDCLNAKIRDLIGKGRFALREEIMRYQTHDSSITFSNGLGPPPPDKIRRG